MAEGLKLMVAPVWMTVFDANRFNSTWPLVRSDSKSIDIPLTMTSNLFVEFGDAIFLDHHVRKDLEPIEQKQRIRRDVVIMKQL